MRKLLFYLIAMMITAGLFSSCRKHYDVLLPSDTPPPVIKVPDEPPAEPDTHGKLLETDPPILSTVRTQISGNIKGFFKAIPARYKESKETYPLIIHFHGGGQYGNGNSDIAKVLKNSIPKMLHEKTFPPSFTVDGEPFSFLILAPQFVRFPSNVDIDVLIQWAKDNLRVDTTRIYLVGFSLGARAAGEYAAYKPGKIAALMSMGGVIPVNSSFSTKCEGMVDTNLPIWHVHNRDDQAWPYTEAVQFIDKINSFSPVIVPRFTTYEVGEGAKHHDCWNKTVIPTYKEDGKNIYEWMLGYKRDSTG